MLLEWLRTKLDSVRRPDRPTNLSTALLTGRLTAYVFARIRGLVLLGVIRAATHYFRFRFIVHQFPLIELEEIATWVLALGLLEGFFHGFCEPLRELARNLSRTNASALVSTVRAYRSLLAVIACLLLLIPLTRNWLPVALTDRVLSVYDILISILALKTFSRLLVLPDFVASAGFSRLHFRKSELFVPDLLIAALLPVFGAIFGSWGVIAHYAFDLTARELIRLRVLLRTRRNIGLSYRMRRFGAPFAKWVHFGSGMALGLTQLLTRLETVGVLALISFGSSSATHLFLLLPLLKVVASAPEIFFFDRMKTRNPLDQWAGEAARTQIWAACIILASLVSLLTTSSAPLLLGVISLGATELQQWLITRVLRQSGQSRPATPNFDLVMSLYPRSILSSHRKKLIEARARLFPREARIPFDFEPSKAEIRAWLLALEGSVHHWTVAPFQGDPPALPLAEEAIETFRKVLPQGSVFSERRDFVKLSSLVPDSRALLAATCASLRSVTGSVRLRGGRHRLTAILCRDSRLVIFLDPTIGPSEARLAWQTWLRLHRAEISRVH